VTFKFGSFVVPGGGGVGEGVHFILKYFSVQYIGRRNQRWLAIDRRVSDHNGDVVGVPNPGESNVELAVGEDRRGQIKGNFLEGLALGLVDGHGEGGAHRELSATDLYGYVLVIRVGIHVDTGDADDVADMTAGEDPGLDDRSG
jgi:hypothetical protein